jgi:PleD family two-component response regulator
MHPKPVVLLASTERSQLRTLQPVLSAGGFDVAVAGDERALLEQAQNRRPHAIVFDVGLAPPGYGLARTLRTDPAVSLSTAIILTGPGRISRAQQLEAWHAGAWDVCEEPFDPDEFLARLDVFVQPRVEVDRLGAECMVDRATGLYNPEGLARRADELAALATRHGLALTCAVFRPTRRLPHPAGSDRLALAFKAAGRTSDAIGRTGQTEFAVFASGTNTWAAAKLVRRMTDSVAREFSYLTDVPRPEGGRVSRPVSVQAGYSATQASHKISPPTLLAKARSALEANRPR